MQRTLVPTAELVFLYLQSVMRISQIVSGYSILYLFPSAQWKDFMSSGKMGLQILVVADTNNSKAHNGVNPRESKGIVMTRL